MHMYISDKSISTFFLIDRKILKKFSLFGNKYKKTCFGSDYSYSIVFQIKHGQEYN